MVATNEMMMKTTAVWRGGVADGHLTITHVKEEEWLGGVGCSGGHAGGGGVDGVHESRCKGQGGSAL